MPLVDYLGMIMTPTSAPAIGDVPMRGVSGGWTTLPIGPSNYVLTVDPATGVPSWKAAGLPVVVPAIVGADSGATILAGDWAQIAGYRSLSYWGESGVYLWIQGNITTPGGRVAGAPIFTIPAPYRVSTAGEPSKIQPLMGMCSTGAAVRIDITPPTGVVTSALAIPAGASLAISGKYRIDGN